MEKSVDVLSGSSQRPSLARLVRRYSSESDCLAAFIALETAEVLAGAKPSALISIPDRPHACGRNFYRLWSEQGRAVLKQTCLSVREIDKGAGFVQLFFYVPGNFSRFLERRDVAALLRRAGYQRPSDREHALDQLEERLRSDTFPHEIGIFLGYPLKDVAAFIGWIKLPFTCQGPWKMFGNPIASLRLAETFRACRRNMAEQLATAQSALDCIAPVSPSISPHFFAV